MSYARLCVEIDVQSDFPSQIDVLVGNVRIKIPVEKGWRPPICSHCIVFGHTIEKCAFVAASDVAAAVASKLVIGAKSEKN